MMKRRCGFTLVEMLVTVSVGSTLMVLAVGIVHQTLLLADAAQDNCECTQATRLFVEQFRRDVHSANKIESDFDNQLTVYGDVDTKIHYAAQGNRITRRQPLANGEQRSDELVLADSSRGLFHVLMNPDRAVFTISHKIELHGVEPQIVRRIEAVVGRLLKKVAPAEALP